MNHSCCVFSHAGFGHSCDIRDNSGREWEEEDFQVFEEDDSSSEESDSEVDNDCEG